MEFKSILLLSSKSLWYFLSIPHMPTALFPLCFTLYLSELSVNAKDIIKALLLGSTANVIPLLV